MFETPISWPVGSPPKEAVGNLLMLEPDVPRGDNVVFSRYAALLVAGLICESSLGFPFALGQDTKDGVRKEPKALSSEPKDRVSTEGKAFELRRFKRTPTGCGAWC